MADPLESGMRTAPSAVLVIDDDLNLAKAASRLLRSMGLEVCVATGGHQAVEFLRACPEKMNVALLDANLRDIDSVTTVQKLRILNPGMKVILTSGYPKQECLDRFGGVQLDGFIPKPFSYAELESAIRAASK